MNSPTTAPALADLPPLSPLAVRRIRAIWRNLGWQLLPEAFAGTDDSEDLPDRAHAPLLAMLRTLHGTTPNAVAVAQQQAAAQEVAALLAAGPLSPLTEAAEGAGRLDLAMDLLGIDGRARLVVELIAASTLDPATAQATRTLADRLGHAHGALRLYDDALSAAGMGAALVSRSCAAGGALARTGAIALAGGLAQLAAPVLDFLDGEAASGSPLAHAELPVGFPQTMLDALAALHEPWLHLLDQALGSRRPVVLSGAAGFGGPALAAIVASRGGFGFRCIDTQAVLAAEGAGPGPLFDAMYAEARLGADVWVLHHLQRIEKRLDSDADGTARFLARLANLQRPVLLIQEGALPPTIAARFADHGCVHIEVPRLEQDARVALLSAALQAHGTAEDLALTLAKSAGQFSLGPERLVLSAAYAHQRAQARFARELAESKADPREQPTVEELGTACTTAMTNRLRLYGSRVKTSSTWEDLVLDAKTLAAVRDIGRFARLRDQIFNEWGLGKKMNYGRALSAMFSGPSGTGKTMVAGLIAQELGVELYRVDLSRVVSKYIGETEERLDGLFSEAAQVGCALLFDEADALFARRTDVQSSNDRYANLEVNYLLQRLEAFDGVVILTTNFATSIDEAFIRRLRFRVTFVLPDADHRAKLWESMLPPELPVSEDLFFKELGDVFELTGGHIRNTVLRAAMLAADADEPLGQKLAWTAAAAEYHELGKLAPPYPEDDEEEDW